MALQYDIIVIGGGIAGLWLANTLKSAGYNVILIEKEKLGAGQTLASQGMIHGGQKYVLEGRPTNLAREIAKMPKRWDLCLEGRGKIDLTSVKVLSGTQVMWPGGAWLSFPKVLDAAKSIGAKMKKLKGSEFPAPLGEEGTIQRPRLRAA